MKLITLILSTLILTGCASNCTEACVFGFGPGNSVFDAYADRADRQDPCQFKGKPIDYELPRFCGASRGKIVRVTKVANNSYRITQ